MMLKEYKGFYYDNNETRADIFADVTAEIKYMFGEGIVSKAFVCIDTCYHKDIKNYIDIQFKHLRNICTNSFSKVSIDIGAMDIRIELMNGKNIEITNSEWGNIEPCEPFEYEGDEKPKDNELEIIY